MLSCSPYLSGKVLKEIYVEKPNPCYYVDRYIISDNTLKVFLKFKSGNLVCPQVIAREKLYLQDPVKIELVEVYVGRKTWKKYRPTN